MKVLVTGASGFLGRQVCQLLAEHQFNLIEVDLFGRTRANTIDVRSGEFQKLVDDVRPDKIVHLAGVQYLNPVKRRNRPFFFQANVDMANAISSALSRVEPIKQVVFVSTDMVYGRVHDSPVKVTAQPLPIGPYGRSKLTAESILTQAATDYRKTLTIFRPRLISGRGRMGTIATLGKLISNDLPVPIFGSGSNRYQLVSKEDVALAIKSSLELNQPGVFNLGSDDPPAVADLISSVIKSRNSRSILLKLPNVLVLNILRFLDKLEISPLSPEQFEIAGLDYVLDTSDTKTKLNWLPTKTDYEILKSSFERNT